MLDISNSMKGGKRLPLRTPVLYSPITLAKLFSKFNQKHKRLNVFRTKPVSKGWGTWQFNSCKWLPNFNKNSNGPKNVRNMFQVRLKRLFFYEKITKIIYVMFELHQLVQYAI